VQLGLAIPHWSQTFDEAAHLYSGYEYWKHGDFGFNPEHPPAAKLVAAAPLLPLALTEPVIQAGTPAKQMEFEGGGQFLFGNDADKLLFRGRMGVAIFTVALACLVWAAAGRMFGWGAACLGLIFFVFEPNILANGALVATDMALACSLFAAVYAFYCYTERPSIPGLLLCGLAAGLAVAVKHSGLIVVAILCLLAAADFFLPRPGDLGGRWKRLLWHSGALAGIVVIAWGVLWAFYGFRFAARPEGLALTPSMAEYAAFLGPAAGPLNALAASRLLPEAYIYGLVDVIIASVGRPAFLLGKVYPHGQWFYFPTAFAIKSTLGFLALVALIPFAGFFKNRDRTRALLFMLLSAGIYLMISMASRLNIGYRHVLPMLPFMIVVAAAAAESVASRRRAGAVFVSAALLFHAGSSLLAFPNYIAYSNEAWGGPYKTYRFLSDSSVDWGQDLKRVGRHLQEENIKDCWFAATVGLVVDPSHYGILCKPLPTFFGGAMGPASREQAPPPSLSGNVLISATELSGVYWGPGELNPYGQFLKIEPTANLGGGVLFYRGQFDVSVLSGEGRVVEARKLLSQDRFEDAVSLLEEAVGLAPRSVRLRFLLAAALAKAGRNEEAEQQRSQGRKLADEMYPDHGLIWTFIIMQ
jgi:4-amino-4-deoxy-L-arabinose transferase-like glycosyltransferase